MPRLNGATLSRLFDAIKADGGSLADAVNSYPQGAPGAAHVDTLNGWGHVAVVPPGQDYPDHFVADLLAPISSEFEGHPLRKDFPLKGQNFDKPFVVQLEEEK